MKTIGLGAIFPGRSLTTPKPSFAQTLKQLPVAKLPPPLPASKKAIVLTPVKSAQQVFGARQATASSLTAARASAHKGVAQLQEVRVAHHHVANERLDSRLVDLICKELVIEFTTEGSSLKVANQDLPLPPPTPNAPVSVIAAAPLKTGDTEGLKPVDGTARAAQAVELIEKIETFIKDSRTPCIALTLNNSLGAKVEIERVGPREVALKVIGHKGPPRAEDIGRIRDEMAARGLKVCALSVA